VKTRSAVDEALRRCPARIGWPGVRDLPNPFSPGPYAECESAATEMAEMPTMVPKFSGSARLWGAA